MTLRAWLARWPVIGAWLVLGLAAGLPLLARILTPPNLLAQTTASTCVALGALSGLGAATRVALDRRPPHVADALGLGLAVFLVLGCALAALHVFGASVQVALLTVGVVLNALALAYYRKRFTAAVATYFETTSGAGVVAMGVVVGVTLLHVVGAGSNLFGSAFDDDGNWLAAAKRLRDTGGFGDIIGYARVNQLGGTVVMTALTATSAEVRSSWLAEGIGFAITIAGLAAIAFPRSGERTVRTRLWQGGFVFLILFLALSAKAQAEKELSAFWIPTALVIACYRLLSAPGAWTSRRSLELGVMVGALGALRLELVPFALVVIVVTTRDPEGRIAVKRLGAALGGLLAGTLPLAIDRLLEGRHLALSLVKLALLIALLALAAFADTRGSRRPLARFAWACAIGTLATYVGPTAAGSYSRAFSWPLMFGFAFLATAELARAQWAPRATTARFTQLAAVSLVAIGMLSIVRAHDPLSRWGWRERSQRWFLGAKLANATSKIGGVEPYAALTGALPPGEPVLVWVDRPELLDFSERRFFDLRVPRYTRTLRKFRWEPPEAPLATIRRSTGAHYLLLQADRLRDKRARDSAFYDIWCSPLRLDAQNSPYFGRPVECADPLERERLHHQVVRAIDNVYLIDLDRPSAISQR